MLEKVKRLFRTKNIITFFKTVFQLCSLVIFIYQFIDITNLYLNFPHEVQLNVTDDNSIAMPSITLCLNRSSFYHKMIFSRNLTKFESLSNIYEEIDYFQELKSTLDVNNYTNFQQLFDITVNLTSLIECSMKIKMNDRIKELMDCKLLGKVLEYMSGDEKMEKCFTFFNLNKLENKTEKYILDKSSFIDFNISLKNFGNTSITGKYKIYNLNGIYLKVHSSMTLSSSSIRIPIRHIRYAYAITRYIYKFSKSVVRNLEWPYATDCQESIITPHSDVYSFEDCRSACILKNILIENECFPYYNNFPIDIRRDISSKNISLCKNFTNKRIDDYIHLRCSRRCHMNCMTDYYEFTYQSKTIYPLPESRTRPSPISTIRIQSANSPIYEYVLNPKLSFFNYASNLGGIISMWFGVAVIDLHKLFKRLLFILIQITRNVKLIEYLRRYLKIFLAYNCILLFSSKFYSFLVKLRGINWKFLIKILCLICFIQQSIKMTLEYLSFKTELSVEMKNHLINGVLESLPALTICGLGMEALAVGEIIIKTPIGGEHLEKQFRTNTICTNNKDLNCTINPYAFLELAENQTTVSDYLKAKEFWYEKVFCQSRYLSSDSTEKWESDREFIETYREIDRCYTCFSNLNNANAAILNKGVVEFRIWKQVRRNIVIFIHDPNHLPSLPNSKITPILNMGQLVVYDKIRLNRLPAPYETDCDHYDGPIKSQAQCFNQLIEELYLRKKCLPKISDKLTYIVDKSNLTNYGHEFCVNVTIDYDENILMKKCKKACKEYLFFVWQTANIHEFRTECETVNKYFISFNFVPKLGFVNYLVNLGGLLGLWHGISLIDLKNILMIKIQKIFSRLNLNNLSNDDLFLIKMLKILQKYAKVKVF
jgi:hypothetical protein